LAGRVAGSSRTPRTAPVNLVRGLATRPSVGQQPCRAAVRALRLNDCSTPSPARVRAVASQLAWPDPGRVGAARAYCF
jgi:hypothetical protein